MVKACGTPWFSDEARLCNAETLPTSRACLAHAPRGEVDSFWEGIRNGSRVGAPFRFLEVSRDVLADILRHIDDLEELDFSDATFIDPVDLSKREFLVNVTFDRSVFLKEAKFESVTFAGSAHFRSSTFRSAALFSGATFRSVANFSFSVFHGGTAIKAGNFTLRRDTEFNRAIFEQGVTFNEARFKQVASFTEVQFVNDAQLWTVVFEGLAIFSGSRFQQAAGFTGSYFGEDLLLAGTSFAFRPHLNGALFEGNVVLTNSAVNSGADFSESRFNGRQVVLNTASEPEAAAISFDRATFSAPLRIESRQAISLEGILLRQPLFLAGSSDDHPTARTADLTSLRSATLEAPLVIGDGIGLGKCFFHGIVGLKNMQIVATDPKWVRYRHRQTLADELSIRAQFNSLEGHLSSWHRRRGSEATGARAVEAIYRQLRVALEASKAAPAAADFYYGEMEMRRLSSSPTTVERWLLLLYKVTSGYGLRAYRAFASYMVALVIAAGLFYGAPGIMVANPSEVVGGAVDFDSFGDVLVKLVVRSSVSFFTPIDVAGLRNAGIITLLTLRLIGPLFFALAILAIRARVER
jgi:uncharacterized protein YjbI with pentapeptide repeats